jgi:hypothetical protein
MYTLPVVLFYVLMAFSTGFGNIEMVYGGFGESGGENLMGRAFSGMAIVAGSREIDPSQCRLTVNAVFEHLHRMFHQDFILLHKIDILVAASAGLREVDGIGFRQLVVGPQYIMFAMAVGTTGSIDAVYRFQAPVPLIFFVLLFMTRSAFHIGKLFLVRQLQNTVMAGLTIQIAMYRSFVNVFIDIK